VIQCQGGLFNMSDLGAGTAILKYDRGYQQYVAVCPLVAGVGGSDGEFRVPRASMTGID
jgi:hypothetical protein